MNLRYAVVCSSKQVKLSGPSIREPNVYEFGSPYKHMYEELRNKDPELYKRNGILPMLKRNSSVKLAPQRWQDNADDDAFDVVFTSEERVFDMVSEDDLGCLRIQNVICTTVTRSL